MDIGKAFTFVFDDERWMTKVLIGGLVGLIPFVGQFLVQGYMLEVARNVAQGATQPLPEWDDWGTKIVRGLMAAIISFLYSLPLLLLACIILFPTMLIGSAMSNGGGDGGGAIAMLGTFCFAFVAIIYSLAMMLVIPAALVRYAVTDDFMAALAFGEIFSMVRSHLGTFLMAWLAALIAGFIAPLGAIACGIGALFTAFYTQTVIGHAYGQAYLTATGGVASQPMAYELPS